MDDQLIEQKHNPACIRQEIHQYVQMMMAGQEPHLPARQKTTLKKSQKS
jgi:hypothetical protein